ncbi:MAG: hypothetical protein ACOCWW_03220 [Bacteroidota bacterium]
MFINFTKGHEQNFNDIKDELEEDDENLDYESWAEMEQDTARNDVEDVLFEVINKYEKKGYIRKKDRQWKDDLQIVGNIDEINIYLRGWQDDIVIGVAPQENLRDMLRDAEDGYSGDEIKCIVEYGTSAQRFSDCLNSKVDAIKKELIYNFIEAGMEPSFKTSGYTTSEYSIEDIGYSDNARDIEEIFESNKKLFQNSFSDEDTLEALKNFIEDNDLDNFYYSIDHEERGEFRASIRHMLNNEIIHEIETDKTGELVLVRDGYMKDNSDIPGLMAYLQEIDVIKKDKQIFKEDEAETIIEKALDYYMPIYELNNLYEDLRKECKGNISPTN